MQRPLPVVSDTYLTAVVPAGATTGSVIVTTPGGMLTSNKLFRVMPQILSFKPTSGTVGTIVTITGVSLTQSFRKSRRRESKPTSSPLELRHASDGNRTYRRSNRTPSQYTTPGECVSSGIFTVTQ